MSTSKQVTGAALVVAILAVGVGVYLSQRPGAGAVPSATATTAPATRYHCPMHPTMVSDRPGDCPICGMRLVPLEEGEDESGVDDPFFSVSRNE